MRIAMPTAFTGSTMSRSTVLSRTAISLGAGAVSRSSSRRFPNDDQRNFIGTDLLGPYLKSETLETTKPEYQKHRVGRLTP